MKQHTKWLLWGGLIIGLLILGCVVVAVGGALLRAVPAPRSKITVAWVQPAEGAVVPWGKAVTLGAGASQPGGGPPPRLLLLWVEGTLVAEAEGPANPLTASGLWHPSHPGRYVLYAQALDASGKVQVATREVTIQAAADDADGDGVVGAADLCPDAWGTPPDGCVHEVGDVLSPGEGTPSNSGNQEEQQQGGQQGDQGQQDGQQGGEGTSSFPDLTPDIPGWLLTDRDGDSVPDVLDACPDIPGLPADNGCPDWLLKGQDLIGPSPAKICAFAPSWCTLLSDSDGDGVADGIDRCPATPGLSMLDGCPLDGAFVGLLTQPPHGLAWNPCESLLEPARSLCETWRRTPPEERPDAHIEVQLGPRLYTNVDWDGVVCYAYLNGIWQRLPYKEQYLSGGADGVWWLGTERERSLKLRVPLRTLHLQILCNGYTGEPSVGIVPLGRQELFVPPPQWDGQMREIVASSRGPHASGFKAFYRVCAEECP